MSVRLAELTAKLSNTISEIIPVYDVFVEECNRRMFEIITEMHEWFYFICEAEWAAINTDCRLMYIHIRKDIQMVAVYDYDFNLSDKLNNIKDTCNLLIQQLKSSD